MASSGFAHWLVSQGIPVASWVRANPRPMTPITFSAQGTPRPQPRPRLARGRVVSVADPNAKRWIATVQSAARQALLVHPKATGPLKVEMLFRMPTPKADRHGTPHTARPDTDNLAKLALDALMRAGLIGDDSAVSTLKAKKIWSKDAGADFVISSDAGMACQSSALPPPEWVGGFG